MKKPLEGEKVRLRAISASDLDLIHAWENDSDTWHLGASAQPYSREVIMEFIASAAHDIWATRQLRMMVETLDGRTIGTIDLFDLDPKNQRVGIGILIASGDDRRQGFATDAVNVLCDYCFDVLGLHQVHCHVTVDNPASTALFRSAGFIGCGTVRDWVRMGRTFVDAELMQRFAAD
jgi:diamine N-acetyltransferase